MKNYTLKIEERFRNSQIQTYYKFPLIKPKLIEQTISKQEEEIVERKNQIDNTSIRVSTGPYQ